MMGQEQNERKSWHRLLLFLVFIAVDSLVFFMFLLAKVGCCPEALTHLSICQSNSRCQEVSCT